MRSSKVKNFDPAQKIFEQFFDPTNKGHISSTTLMQVFKSLGHGKISNEDINAIVRAADFDLDGKISLQDFRAIVDSGKMNER